MKTISYCLFSLLILLTPVSRAFSQDGMERWVDSVFNSLTLEERIAQLMIVRANQPGRKYDHDISRYIRKYNIGGVAFFRGNARDQARTTNKWQSLAKTPLFVTIDAEWGLGMRVNDAISYPFQMTLGAIREDTLIYEMGRTIAEQCRRLGVHINFAPVADINSNPVNPIIGMRSFGEDKAMVSNKAIAYMKGMKEHGILTTAKHFPGHGDTETDSHKTLPVISHDKERLDTIELYPFKRLIDEDVDGIMIAHLYIPDLERRENMAATLSDRIVDKLLRRKMGFEGLVVTDALDMEGVTRYHKPGEIELLALMAGNDILLLPEDVHAAIRTIKEAITTRKIKQSLVDDRCRKILRYKYIAGLNNQVTIDTDNLVNDLNKPVDQHLSWKLFSSALTLIKNKDSVIPLKRLDTLNIASISVGGEDITPFQKTLSSYAPVAFFPSSANPGENEIDRILDELKDYNLLTVDFQNTNIFPWDDFGISTGSLDLLRRLVEDKKVILNLPASPYAIHKIPETDNIIAFLVSYQDDIMMQEIAAQAIFGGVPIQGSLPIDIAENTAYSKGIQTQKTRLQYSTPECLGIDRQKLVSVDSIVRDAISEEIFPGCAVIAAKDGIVFYKKTFGHHTYKEDKKVRESDLYDLASLTKILATTPAIMKLTSENKIDVDDKLGWHLPYLSGSNKEDLVIREIMAHQARLRPWIPYYQYTLDEKGNYIEGIYNAGISEEYSVRVAEELFINEDYAYVIYDSIRISELRDTLEYKYSDLGFYLLVPIIENITNKPVQDYVLESFYKPLGLTTMGYLPRERFPLERIIPTEEDRIFRKQLLQGDVHDQGAALLGGASGHAGLFSNANDIAIFMQMLLQDGSYGGEQFIDSMVVYTFTSTQFPLNDNRRGIGFDKPLLVYDEEGPACKSASSQSFGHSGFTGTYAWADPENNLIYVFLSNRIYPDASNNKIMELDIRTKIHQVFYDALNNE